MRYYATALFLAIVLAVPWAAVNYPLQTDAVLSAIGRAGGEFAAAILSHNPKSIADIQTKYEASTVPQSPKVKILIVPGHEPDYGGAEYKDPTYGPVLERELTVELGQDLQDFLKADGHYQTFITRDTQAWNPVFADYFKQSWASIISWMKDARQDMAYLISVGSTTKPVAQVIHHAVPDDVAIRLYGITKWANDNDIDITVHIHFNDYPGHGSGSGKYTGFAIYVPEHDYANSPTTRVIAKTVFSRLAKYNAVSDLKGESTGIVEEPDLIAIGANNTANSASMLIEYSYIYEPQVTDPAVRHTFLKELAYETYLGLQDFFAPVAAAKLSYTYDTLMLPHSWGSPLLGKNDAPEDVFALQTALVQDGDYPPTGRTMNDCPRSGKIGPCTKTAIQEFQDKHGISGEPGIVGPKTIEELNQLYSTKVI